MRGILIRRYGGPEVLEYGELPDPEPGPGEVLIRVRVAGVNFTDVYQRTGTYPGTLPFTPGVEGVGTVEKLGNGVTSVRMGDRVGWVMIKGGYAERVVVPEGIAMRVPSALDLVSAAAIPEAFLTAREALFAVGELQATESVLIHAAAGGVGSAAVQLARRAGARVFATAGGVEKCAWLRALGADTVIDYKSEDFAAVIQAETSGQGVNVILDFVGGAYAEKHAACLAARGRQVVIGVLGGSHANVNLSKLIQKRQSLRGVVMRSRSNEEKVELTRAFVRTTLPLLADGRLRALVDSTFPLSEVARAHERMEQNANLGKIVLRVR